MAVIPPEAWSAIAVALTVIFTFFGLLVKLIADARKDNKELQDKVMDRAIPALESNAEATKMMVSVTQQTLTALAVAQAVRNETNRHSQEGK